MHAETNLQMALERQAGLRADARRRSLARAVRRRHDLPVEPAIAVAVTRGPASPRSDEHLE